MFTYYEPENAPEGSKELMEKTYQQSKFIPNLHKILAESPSTYEAYKTTFALFMNNTSFTPVEKQVVFMTANFENDCAYCVPGHTWMMKNAKMPDDVIEALRNGSKLPDPKLQALHDYTKELLDNRGHIGDKRLKAFLNAGYTTKHALEVLIGLSSKLISNFTNALANTKLDSHMKPYEWTHPNK